MNDSYSNTGGYAAVETTDVRAEDDSEIKRVREESGKTNLPARKNRKKTKGGTSNCVLLECLCACVPVCLCLSVSIGVSGSVALAGRDVTGLTTTSYFIKHLVQSQSVFSPVSYQGDG